MKQRVFSRPAESVTQTLQSLQWPMNPRSRSLATTPPTRWTTGQPRLTTWTRKGLHQRGMPAIEAPTVFNGRPPPHDPDPEERPPAKCTHLRRAPTIQEPLSKKETHHRRHLPIRAPYQQAHSPTEPISHERRIAPGTLPRRPRQLRTADTPRGTPRLAARARASAPWRGAKIQARAKKAMSTRTIVAPVGMSMDHER